MRNLELSRLCDNFWATKNEQTTVNAYAGIDSRRAARHHQHLIENAIDRSE
jgi:hypothetical protein